MEDFIIANCTDTGKVRAVNEDSMSTFDSPNGRVVVVCDGMGGQNAGDVASQLAVTVIQDILCDNKFNTPEEAISKSIIAANQAILMRASQDASLSGMGSTCVMLIISDGKVYYGSVGDSRIYYSANGMIRQLTKDQSYVQTLVDAGEISQEAAEHHKDKNQITNALGIEGMTPPVVCQMPITPEPGSVFLLCSDGLSGMINSNVINQVISNSSLSLQDKAKELVSLANNAGGIDNITVQLVEFPKAMSEQARLSSLSGNKKVNGSKSNRAAMYWAVTIVCLILAIGGGTWWLVTKEESKPVKPVISNTTKSDVKGKDVKNSKSSNSVDKPSSESSHTNEAPKVMVIEIQKPESSKSSKSEKKSQIVKEQVSKMSDQDAKKDTIKEVLPNIKEVDNSNEKN